MLAGRQPVGRLADTKQLDLAIGLPLRNREVLTNLLVQLYDPASPNFRHYLTPQQFAEQFGPTEADYQAVLDFASSNHLVVRGTHPNRMLLDVNGAAADIERAFHVNLRLYRHPTEPRTFFAPDTEPSIDAHLPVLSIAGLDNFYQPRPMDLRRAVPAILDATGSGPSGTFLGSDFRAAYAPGITLNGSGQSVGLLEFDSYYPGDIAQYEQLAGLPDVTLSNVMVSGSNRQPGLNNNEVALDIEMAISMAPGLSKVMVYEGSIGNDILNRMATDNQARQLSSSWGFGLQVDPTREQIYQQFAAQGQSMFQASGDAGAYGTLAYQPADDPLVTAVGGTSLTTAGPGGSWSSERAWAGSGGGISSNYGLPIWQQGVSTAANHASAIMRNVPDVAALADTTIWVIANNGEQGTVGGTSAAAPLWAGFTALVNQQAAAANQPAVGFLNPAIYAIGHGPAYATAFHDITTGNNTNAASPDRFFAVPGYDLCTGWGTPSGSNLISALLAPPDALTILPGINPVLAGPVGGPFGPPPNSFVLTNSGAGPLSWSLSSTSAWVNVSMTNGTLTPAGPAAVVNLGLTPAAKTLPAGSYVANLWFTNLGNGFVQQRQFILQVVTPPVLTGQPASLALPTGATARFAAQVATNAFLTFQWRAHGTNLLDGGNLVGASASTLTLSNVTAGDNGSYSVLVSNAAGFTVSSAATLTVTSSAPIIAIGPAGQTLLPGANATLAVLAFGDPPLSYQWRTNGIPLVDGGRLSGSSTDTLTISNISSLDAGTYSVVVSNALGSRITADAQVQVVSLTSPELVQALVHGFSGLDGARPNGLTRGLDGRIYGSTRTGGAGGAGTVFELDASGRPNSIYSFTGLADGARPNEGLVQFSDGVFFGTTYTGGTNGFGTIFELSTNGSLNTLFTLDHTNGVLPTAGPTGESGGALYGTAYEGGIFHFGTVFRLETNGTFDTLVPFNGTNGSFPHAGLVRSQDGNFYGTTYKGGAYGYGTIFRLSSAGTLTVLASFDGTNGAFPLAGLTEASDGNFYGCTSSGGTFRLGNLFQMSRSGSVSNLVSFTGGSDGSHPLARLMQANDGNLYGTTSDGGSFGAGTVFRLSPQGVLTTIAEFDGFNGANPEAPLFQNDDGTIYGVTPNGGPFDQGVIFQLSIPSSGPQITSQPASATAYAGSMLTLQVACFGSSPLSYQWQKNATNLADAGAIAGTRTRVLSLTNVGAGSAGLYSVIISNAFGSVVSAPAEVQVLASAPFFAIQPTNQTQAAGANVILSATVLGNQPLSYHWQLAGTNLNDSGNLSGSVTDTLLITNATQANNGSYLLVASNILGSATSAVAVLSIVPATAPGTRLATLYWFGGGADGLYPSQLTDGLDGYLYGTTELGGAFRDGTLFRVATNGAFATLFSFNQTNGAIPLAGLVCATNGLLYGTASAGGAFYSGKVFQFARTGEFTSIYDFTGNGDGGVPGTMLVQGIDGNLYGSTSEGGTSGYGTLFQVSSSGSNLTFHSFNGGLDGNSVAGPLLPMPDGSLYGLTPGGGNWTNGSVFRITPGGPFTTVYSFTGDTDGYVPVGGLVPGDDGYLYGATRYNTIRGFAFYGTLFKVGTNGNLTTLYSLNFTDGSHCAAGLVQGADGNFYGTTEQGGANDYGTVFRLTPAGAFSTLVEFDGFDTGADPLTSLTPGPDGALYGTTSSGGPGGHGTIFRLSFTGAPQLTAQPISQTAFTGKTASFSVAVTGSAPFWFQWQKNGTNLANAANISGANTRVLTLGLLSPADVGTYSVIVTNASGLVTSATATLAINILPPSLHVLVQSSGSLQLTWNTVPGQVYQLQANPGLSAGGWTNAGSPLTATGENLSISVPLNDGLRQFYRVILLP